MVMMIALSLAMRLRHRCLNERADSSASSQEAVLLINFKGKHHDFESERQGYAGFAKRLWQ